MLGGGPTQIWRRYEHLAAVCNRNSVTDLNSVRAEAAKAQSQVPQMARLGLGSQLAGKSFPGLGAFRSDSPVCRRGRVAALDPLGSPRTPIGFGRA